MSDLQTLLLTCSTYDRPFERFLQGFQGQTNQVKGQWWESFCQLYLCKHKGYDVWTLRDLPADLREQLSLRTQDMGIDLIARDSQGKLYAVQCKFRSRQVNTRRQVTLPPAISNGSFAVPKRVTIASNQVSWQELSTFRALCARTGPWHQWVVMTTANSVRSQGRKSSQDRTYAYLSFASLTKIQWIELCGSEGHRVDQGSAPTTTQALREARCRHYSQLLSFQPKCPPPSTALSLEPESTKTSSSSPVSPPLTRP